mgnify:CR=1 FL=1
MEMPPNSMSAPSCSCCEIAALTHRHGIRVHNAPMLIKVFTNGASHLRNILQTSDSKLVQTTVDVPSRIVDEQQETLSISGISSV